MDFIKSWKESLGLLAPQNLKPFVLVAVKNVLDIYKRMNKPLTARGNWISIIILVILIVLSNTIRQFHLFGLEAILLNSILHFLFFIFLLGMRPSIALKDWSYFKQYLEKYWYLLGITIFFGIAHVYIIPFFFIFYMLFLLFMFDSYGSLHDIGRSLKNSGIMLFYNLPVFLVLYGVLGIVNLIEYLLIAFALGYFGGLAIAILLYVLIAPIQVVFIINLYIRFIHGQPLLYFKQPE